MDISNDLNLSAKPATFDVHKPCDGKNSLCFPCIEILPRMYVGNERLKRCVLTIRKHEHMVQVMRQHTC